MEQRIVIEDPAMLSFADAPLCHEQLIVVDSIETIAVSPTFAGMCEEPAVSDTYGRIAEALLELYGRRYRNTPPTSLAETYAELVAELHLPFETLIGKAINVRQQRRRLCDADEETLMRIADDCIRQLRSL